ncbi:MAG: transglutaminase domain-containing protein, partial [Clostridiaceae bacterium]|nr:transglutaminase domain-containing protein [Clostridiaceae bacterium]
MTLILFLVIPVYRHRPGIYKAWPRWTALVLACLLLTACQPRTPPSPNPPAPSEAKTSNQTTRTSPPASSRTSPASSPPTWTKPPALSADPRVHPDPLAVRDDHYPDQPVFFSQNHVSRYLLHQFLQGHFDLDFYLDSQLAPDEGTGFFILSQACQTALSYHLFSAFDVQNMYTKEDPSGRIQAFISLEYSQPKLDQMARQAAARFIRENPVPQEGFSDFYSERAYALKIHDFIARKVTYSPLGYNPELMIGMDKYQACQEAYNVLVAEDDTAVCAGYARAFALIAQYAGINCAWVYGNESEDLTES